MPSKAARYTKVSLVDTSGAAVITSGGVIVQGSAADGAALAGNPLRLGISDGTTIQTVRQFSASNIVGSVGVPGVGIRILNGAGDAIGVSGASVTGDGVAGGGLLPAAGWLLNSVGGYDRLRSAGGAAATTGAGLLGAALLTHDGTNYQLARTTGSVDTAVSIANMPAVIAGLRASSGNFHAPASAQAIGDTNNGSRLSITGIQNYNESTFDYQRGNAYVNIFNSTRTATANESTQTNYNGQGIAIFLSISAASGTTPTLDIKLQFADAAGTFYDATDSAGNVIAFAQKTTTGNDQLYVGRGLIEKLTTTFRRYTGLVPRTWRLVSTIGGTTPSFTYRLDVCTVR